MLIRPLLCLFTQETSSTSLDQVCPWSRQTVPDLGRDDGLFQGLQHVGKQIGFVLDAAADTHEVVKDTGGLALLFGDAAVGHGAGHFDERLDTAETLGEREDAGRLAEALGCLVAAADAEREHPPAHAVAVLLQGDSALGVRGQAGVVD